MYVAKDFDNFFIEHSFRSLGGFGIFIFISKFSFRLFPTFCASKNPRCKEGSQPPLVQIMYFYNFYLTQ